MLHQKICFNGKKGNKIGALKLSLNNIFGSTLHLYVKTINLSKQKLPKSRKLIEEFILCSEKPNVNPVIFEDLDEEKITIAAVKTKGSDVSLG